MPRFVLAPILPVLVTVSYLVGDISQVRVVGIACKHLTFKQL